MSDTAVVLALAGVTLLAATTFAMRRYSRERRLVETDLRDSRARYDALVEHLPYAVLVERLGEVVFANTAVAQLLGAESPQAIVGRDLSALIETGSDQVLARQMSIVEEPRSRACPVELGWLRQDGGAIVCETSIESMQWDGQPATLVLLRDLTDRKLAEAAQRATEARLGTIVDSVMDAIISIDEHQRVVLFNMAAERIFGVDASVALGQPLERFIPERLRGAHRKHVYSFQQTGVTKRRMGALGALSGLRSNGEEFPIEASISQTTVEGHRVFTVVLRDITERMRTETELQLAQERLAHMARLSTMGEMASGLSHEINQPLTAIATYAQALERIMQSSEPADREEVREALRQISAQALRAGEVIRRLKSMIKNREPDFRALDCHELISDVLALAEIDARSQHAEVRSIGAFRGVQVRGDAVQLQQVLINLIRNALDALGTLPAERRVITVALNTNEPGTVEFSVIDHGPGIPAESARQMFGPFFTTKTHGTGLGLAISRSIVEAHRGRLSHRPTPGGGATFSFTLPLLTSMEIA